MSISLTTMSANASCVESATNYVNAVAKVEQISLNEKATKALHSDESKLKYSILARGAGSDPLICQYDIQLAKESQKCELVSIEKVGCSNFESLFE